MTRKLYIQYHVSLAFGIEANGKDIGRLSLMVDAAIDHRLHQVYWGYEMA